MIRLPVIVQSRKSLMNGRDGQNPGWARWMKNTVLVKKVLTMQFFGTREIRLVSEQI